MKELPVDVSSFSRMRSRNFIYIDKTEYIYNLFSGGAQYYFLSRPRRFGKSLLVSTLGEIFSGNKQLFEGLWISQSDYDWQQYPVITLDFSTIARKTPEDLEISLILNLNEIAKAYSVDISEAQLLNDKFVMLIKKLADKNKVVLLVDEYDKPILDHITDIPKAEAIRTVLSNFYDALKGMDNYMRAIFVTGVTKFAKTSLFSGINNLNDISIKPEADAILGYTYEEINTNFDEYLQQIAVDKPLPTLLEAMQRWYNGYRFSDKETKVYNPFSVLYYLKDKKLRNYWFQSGTPTFLINLLRQQYNDLSDLKKMELDPDSLVSFQINDIPLVPLLFQAGYLTFVDYNANEDKFILGFPNFEVEASFKKFLVGVLSYSSRITVDTLRLRLLEALNNNSLDDFCRILLTLFAHIPNTLKIDKESYYHSLFQFAMSLLSLEAQSEYLTNIGRIDMVVPTKKQIYIFEFKLNIDSSKALQQILDKKYYERFMELGKEIVLVGISINTKDEAFVIEHSSQILN